MATPATTVSAELKGVLRQVKLGRCLDTLPERLALAKTRNMGHAEFLELVLSDEVTRRETSSAALRAGTAGLDPDMCLEHWDKTTEATFDRQTWDELCSLRLVDAGGKDLHGFCPRARGRAPALHGGVLPHRRVAQAPAGQSPGQQPRHRDAQAHAGGPAHPGHFALQPFDALDPADIYELVVERHRSASTLITSNREPVEWI
jgi:hypothetical protein